jgi:putative Holliday junction resolvase
MKFLGLDIGDRRIGIAHADSEVRIATPVAVVERVSLQRDVRAIGDLARKYEAAQLIVGLPRNMDGTSGAQAEAVIAYAEKIAHAVNLPVVFWDERLSTVEATRRAHETSAPAQRRRRKKSRHTLDAIAAAVILQDYLDA